MGIMIDSNWGCGSECGNSDTKNWGPNSIYNVQCSKCNNQVEFFKDEKKRSCDKCGDKITNPHLNKDCC